MSALPTLPGLALTASLAIHLAGGLAVGVGYFGSIWWNAQSFTRSGRLRSILASMAARFAVLAGVLTLVSLEGAMPLLATALGFFLARTGMLRTLGAPAP